VKRELSHFVDLIAPLEETTGRLVPQVVEAQVLYSKDTTGSRESRTDALGIVGKDVLTRLRLAFDDFPGFSGEFETTMIAFLVSRVLGITDEAGTPPSIVVPPFKPTDFSFSPRRLDRKPRDIPHRNAGPSISPSKVFIQFCKFLGRWAAITSATFADQS
jgi:hypothetical protein